MIKNKKVVFIAINILLLNVLIFSNKHIYQVKENSTELLQYYNKLYKMIKDEKKLDKKIIEIMDFTFNKIKNNELYLIIDEKKEKGLITKAYFVFPTTEKVITPYIVLPANILKMEQNKHSIIYSILFHELKHAFDYFMDTKYFIRMKENILEEYLFEIDAYFYELMLIKEVLVKYFDELTKFEQFMLASYKTDELNSFSMAFKGIHLHIIKELYWTKNDSNISYEDNIKYCIDIGNKILANFKYNENDNNWNRFVSLVPIFTYYIHIDQILYEVYYTKKRNVGVEDFNSSEISPKINIIKNELKTYIDKYNNEYKDQIDFYINRFEEEFNNE